jgi:hypothetical protein
MTCIRNNTIESILCRFYGALCGREIEKEPSKHISDKKSMLNEIPNAGAKSKTISELKSTELVSSESHEGEQVDDKQYNKTDADSQISENRLKVVVETTTLTKLEVNVNKSDNIKNKESEVENAKSKTKDVKAETSKSGLSESAESLREEIDQLLAPILFSQNEIAATKQRVTPDSEQFLIRFEAETESGIENPEMKDRVQEARSKRSPSSIVCNFIEEAIIENNSSNEEHKSRVNLINF